jgi:transcriptional regulator with XRE-family HTH domain
MDELKRLRKARGLSQAKLAALAGLDPSTVSQIETGARRANTRTLERLAEALSAEVVDLFPKGQAPLPLKDGSLMDRPDIAEWLRQQGHLTAEEFLSRAEDIELEVDEDEFPHPVEDAIEEVHRERDHLLEVLRTPKARRFLFPPVDTEGLVGDERLRAVFRPTRLARELSTEIRHEYLAREVALVNYSKELFVSGKASGYLAYGSPTHEYADKSHRQMLEARRRTLEESYAKAAAI